jgi:hypothetical protein
MFADAVSSSVAAESVAMSVVSAKLSIVMPLIAACALVVVSIPTLAHRGKLHIPGYAAIAMLGFVLALLFGKFASAHSIAGTAVGVFFSLLCFLFLAVAAGSIVALFLYRNPSGA